MRQAYQQFVRCSMALLLVGEAAVGQTLTAAADASSLAGLGKGWVSLDGTGFALP